MAYSTTEKLKILNYAKEHGLTKTANDFGVTMASIILWNKKYNVYSLRKKRVFSCDEKVSILKETTKYGLNYVVSQYNIVPATLYKWNRELKVCDSLRQPVRQIKKRRFTIAERREILTYVKDHSLVDAMRKYNVPSTVIYRWNDVYRIFKKRNIRHFTDTQKSEILQYASDKDVARAAHKYNVAAHIIRNWINQQKQY